MGSRTSQQKRRPENIEDKGALVIQILGISLFVILLAFFILLNAIAVVDEKKVKAAVGSLLASFSGDTGGYSIVRESGEILPGTKIQTETGTMDFSKLAGAPEEWSRQISIRKNPRGTLVEIPSQALFESGGPNLTSNGRGFLDKLSGLLQENRQPVEISAHAGGQTVETGQPLSNRELTSLQATNVLRYLVTEKKIAPQRLTACGWGSHRPAYADDTETSRAMNSRIELLVIHQGLRPKPQSGFIFQRFFFRTLE